MYSSNFGLEQGRNGQLTLIRNVKNIEHIYKSFKLIMQFPF
jgi:hypothetical protein